MNVPESLAAIRMQATQRNVAMQHPKHVKRPDRIVVAPRTSSKLDPIEPTKKLVMNATISFFSCHLYFSTQVKVPDDSNIRSFSPEDIPIIS